MIRQNGTLLNGTAHVRTGIPEGAAFLADGIASESANRLTEPLDRRAERPRLSRGAGAPRAGGRRGRGT